MQGNRTHVDFEGRCLYVVKAGKRDRRGNLDFGSLPEQAKSAPERGTYGTGDALQIIENGNQRGGGVFTHRELTRRWQQPRRYLEANHRRSRAR